MVAALWVSGGVLFVLSDGFVCENDRFLWALFTVAGIAYVVSANAIVQRQSNARCPSIDAELYGTHAGESVGERWLEVLAAGVAP